MITRISEILSTTWKFRLKMSEMWIFTHCVYQYILLSMQPHKLASTFYHCPWHAFQLQSTDDLPALNYIDLPLGNRSTQVWTTWSRPLHSSTMPRKSWVKQRLISHQTHYRSYRERLLQVIWPNQQCQSTEGNQLVLQVRPESHQDHTSMLHTIIQL